MIIELMPSTLKLHLVWQRVVFVHCGVSGPMSDVTSTGENSLVVHLESMADDPSLYCSDLQMLLEICQSVPHFCSQ